ncbi:MAG: NAD(P)/FAD-dependent oxidoreductase [Elusimicrobiota bacterium]
MNVNNRKVKDITIIGGGPAGLSSALYGARAGLDVLVLDKNPAAGALAYARKIENYPGVMKPVSGPELLNIFKEHAEKFGAQILQEQVVDIDLNTSPKRIVTYNNVYSSKTVIVATGAMARTKSLPGEEEFLGKGVSYCAACDAPFFKDKKVALAGSASEIQEELPAIYKFAAKIHLVVTGKLNKRTAEEYEGDSKIKLYEKHRLREMKGNNKLEKISIYGAGKDKEIDVDGVFIFLPGNSPVVGFLNDQIDLREDNCIKVSSKDMSSSVKGVYAAGDVVCKEIRQVAIAVSEGCIAALSAASFIDKNV